MSRIERNPDPTYMPCIGDEYVSSNTGVVVHVTKVEEGRVHFKANNGWGASSELDHFVRTSRRVLREEGQE